MAFVTAPRKLTFPVLRAPDTAYAGMLVVMEARRYRAVAIILALTGTPGKRAGDAPLCTGTDCTLVGAMQARNSARFLLIGSLAAFSDKLAAAPVDGVAGKYVEP
jgi:hypothetical protein